MRNKQTKRKGKNIGRRRLKKGRLILFLIILFSLIAGVVVFSVYKKSEKIKLYEQNKLLNDIKEHYNNYVVVSKNTKLYKNENNEYKEDGLIGVNQELELEAIEVTYNDKYFKIVSFDEEYYIYYKDVNKISDLSEVSVKEDRYKKYIPFNVNVVTNDVTNFYDENDNLVYSFNKTFELPVIVKKEDTYGVEYNNRLLYVNSDDVKEVLESKNTDLTNTSSIAVLNYHFFNDSDDSSDRCDQIICLSTNNLKKHLNYIKDNNIFTPNMKELEMYIDGYIQLPKSVVLTIDDGWRAKIGSDVIASYGLNATIFLMSKYYDAYNYENDYIEVHSHGYDIHNGGMCPGGQGGEIKCMEKGKLLDDLKLSRERINNTTYFCYPFYEYNDYSISVLKEAGFTMAFGGYGEGGNYKVKPGVNKFKLPRYVIYSYTTDISAYVK